MAFKHKPQRYVYKIHSKKLRKAKWKLSIHTEDAMKSGELIGISDSTVLRWLDELNGETDNDTRVAEINHELRYGDNTTQIVRKLTRERMRLLLKRDFISVVMDSKKDYEKLAKDGFWLNDRKYVRLLSTTNGIKNSTIIFCAEEYHAELRRRLDNGRDLNKPIVPAKFGAYEALACSSSVPVSMPKGILVVPDCYTEFTENILVLDDRDDGEPKLTYEKDYQIRKDVSDGFGTITPERAKIWSDELGLDYTFSGCNTRCAFLKGMLVVFDHVAFAEEVNGASQFNPQGYLVKDIWGDVRDVRDVDVVFTESMLKLWDSYKSIEDYLANCRLNNYTISIPKVSPKYLDDEWTTNYQFLQSYSLSDGELDALIKPTVDNITDLLGGDYRKILLYTCGRHINERDFISREPDFVKALMIEPKEINDPYVEHNIREMLNKRIKQAKLGKIDVHGNFELACGDPYALWQSIFGLEVTGLLCAGSIYSEYWNNCGAEYVSCFRAPMTSEYNIKKMYVSNYSACRKWYEHIHTMVIFNAWDTATDAMNGEDFDGDLNFITDNEILVRNTKDNPTIMCVQRRADKFVITPELLVRSDIQSFGNDIGKITNDITSQIDIVSNFEDGSLENDTLRYRIICGQTFQQNSIDKAKGIITKPRPANWFNMRDNMCSDDDSESTKHHKRFDRNICVTKKPYFMIYNYDSLNRDYKKYNEAARTQCRAATHRSLADLIGKGAESHSDKEFLDAYYDGLNVTVGNCLVNKICAIIENKFGRQQYRGVGGDFDFSFLKPSDSLASRTETSRLNALYKIYCESIRRNFISNSQNEDENSIKMQYRLFLEYYRNQCLRICPNVDVLVSTLIDKLYKTNASKKFVWNLFGDVIIEHLLESHNYKISLPVREDDEPEFYYRGVGYKMTQCDLKEAHNQGDNT